MSCNDEFKTLLSRYVDGELGPDERAKVDAHVSQCDGCRELLSLFQKNENLLSGALSTDAFGDAVIESVVKTIGREAVPEKEGVLDWMRSRPWLAAAAAVLGFVGILAWISSSHSAQMTALKEEIEGKGKALKEQSAQLKDFAAELQAQGRASADLAEQLGKQVRRRRVGDAFGDAQDRAMVGYVEVDRYLVVRAVFEGKYAGFNVFRRGESDKPDAFVRLNEAPLLTPEYTDRSAKQGQGYIYRFQAVRPSGETVDSVPLLMRLSYPGDLSPEKSIRVYCENLAAPKDLGAFVLERVVNGKPVSARFYVNVGNPVGGKIGDVDFTTDLILARIEDGTESLPVYYTHPVTDDKGNPIMERVVGDVWVPKYEQVPASISTRENRKAILKLKGTTSEKSAEPLWKGSSMRVPVRD